MKSIADVVGASGLAGYAEVALLLFFFVFVVVGLRALLADRSLIDRAAHLPLDDDRTPSLSSSTPRSGRGD